MLCIHVGSLNLKCVQNKAMFMYLEHSFDIPSLACHISTYYKPPYPIHCKLKFPIVYTTISAIYENSCVYYREIRCIRTHLLLHARRHSKPETEFESLFKAIYSVSDKNFSPCSRR